VKRLVEEGRPGWAHGQARIVFAADMSGFRP
jgi:hypothetical protein